MALKLIYSGEEQAIANGCRGWCHSSLHRLPCLPHCCCNLLLPCAPDLAPQLLLPHLPSTPGAAREGHLPHPEQAVHGCHPQGGCCARAVVQWLLANCCSPQPAQAVHVCDPQGGCCALHVQLRSGHARACGMLAGRQATPLHVIPVLALLPHPLRHQHPACCRCWWPRHGCQWRPRRGCRTRCGSPRPVPPPLVRAGVEGWPEGASFCPIA